MNKKIKTVAILGGGPTACALGILLTRKGIKAAMFYVPKQATLIVGESTVPAIVPILRLLGVEDEVRGYSELKPGATVNMSPEHNFYFHFWGLPESLTGSNVESESSHISATLPFWNCTTLPVAADCRAFAPEAVLSL